MLLSYTRETDMVYTDGGGCSCVAIVQYHNDMQLYTIYQPAGINSVQQLLVCAPLVLYAGL